MAIKTFKPYTPARRNMTVSAFDGVDKKAKPERSLVETLKKNAGRNSYGHITVRHRGGGNKRKYRVIDFKRLKTDMSATVQRIEYDPNRSAFIALIKYEDGTLSYILAPYGLNVGDQVLSWLRKASWRRSVYPPAKSATFTPTALPASVRWAIWITRTSTSVRPAVPATWVSVPPSAAPS